MALLLLFILPMTPTDAIAASGWGEAEIIETEDKGNAVYPDLAMDGSGNAIAVWTQRDGVRVNVWSNRYNNGRGWGHPELIEHTDEDSEDVSVGLEKNGNAMAVWKQYDGARYNLWSNRYLYGVGWGSPELVETLNSKTVYIPNVAVGPSGVAVAVWSQLETTGFRTWSNTFVPGEGWGTEKPIETDLTTTPSFVKVSVDPKGNAIAMWYKSDGIRNSVWYNQYSASSSWGNDKTLEDSDQEAAGNRVEFDLSGNAMAAWTQNDGTRYDIWCRRYTPSGGWETEEKIDSEDKGDAVRPDIGFDADGNAIIVWEQHDSIRFNIWARRYDVYSGWEDPSVIEKDDFDDAKMAVVAVDPQGGAMAVWKQSDGARNNIWANRFMEGSGWGTPELVEMDNTGDAERPAVSAAPSGDVIAVWHQRGSEHSNIWASRFVKPDIKPPPLSLLTPSDGSVWETSMLRVSGITEPGASLDINGISVIVAANGSFSCPIPLQGGPNRMVVTAIDGSGNSASIVRNVTYDDGMETLKNRIDMLEEELEVLSGSMKRTIVDIVRLQHEVDELSIPANETEVNLTGILENISRLGTLLDGQSENLSYISGALAMLEGTSGQNGENISSMMERLDFLGSNIDESREDLDELTGKVDSIQGPSDDLEEELDTTKEDIDDVKGLNTVLFILLGINLFVTLLVIIIMLLMFTSLRKRTTGPDGIEE